MPPLRLLLLLMKERLRNEAVIERPHGRTRSRSIRGRRNGVQMHFPFRPYVYVPRNVHASGRIWIVKVGERLVGIADWHGKGKKVLRLAAQRAIRIGSVTINRKRRKSSSRESRG
jgi:hypothetical protein